MNRYGGPPAPVGAFELAEWDELMHYLYLPVMLPTAETEGPWVRVPKRLRFLDSLLAAAWHDWLDLDAGDPRAVHVYVTARRGFATPDNPLNRPGWHCDGFGTDDTNYVWWDRWGTRFAEQPFAAISEDHLESMRQFESQVIEADAIVYPNRILYRLDPFVVHATPLVPPGGGMRSFLKVSISRHRYNLVGNSRNHLFDYGWKMWPRDAARNDPARALGDFYEDRAEEAYIEEQRRELDEETALGMGLERDGSERR